jgi:hypothetical protein
LRFGWRIRLPLHWHRRERKIRQRRPRLRRGICRICAKARRQWKNRRDRRRQKKFSKFHKFMTFRSQYLFNRVFPTEFAENRLDAATVPFPIHPAPAGFRFRQTPFAFSPNNKSLPSEAEMEFQAGCKKSLPAPSKQLP